MPTVSEYRDMLGRAVQAGDTAAEQYFRSQIAKGEAMPPVTEKPQAGGKGTILSPLAQGATLGFSDEIAGGLSGLHSLVTGKGKFGDAYTKTRDDFREASSQYAERHPFLSPAVELVTGAALPLGAARSVAQGARLGAGAGAVTGAGKSEDPDNMAGDVALGAGLGGAGGGAGAAAGGLFRMIFPRRSANARAPGYQADIDRLAAEGIPTTPGERLGSPSLRAAEKQVDAYFGAGDDLASRPNAVRSRLMARGGFDPEDVQAGELSDAAVTRASQHFSNEYDRILRGHSVDLQDMDPALAAVERRFFNNNTMLPFEQKAEVRNILDDFRDLLAQYQTPNAAGNLQTTVTGGAYKRLRSNMGKRARQLSRQEGPNASLAPIYRDIQGALDDAFRASAPRSLVRDLATTDSQYRHYAFLRDVAQNPHDINAIANRVLASNADDDLKELVRAYQNVVIRGGKGEGTVEASGNLVPPVMSMLKVGGGRIADSVPQPARPLPELPQGTLTGMWGQGGGMATPEVNLTGKQAERRRKRRQRVRHDDGDHEYR